MIDNLKIRPFDPQRDMEDALKCFNEGFYHTLWPSIENAKPSLHKDFIRFFHLMSTEALAAEISGEVHGIIFGAAPFKIRGLIKTGLFSLFYILPKVLINAYGMDLFGFKHFFRLVTGFAPFIFFHPLRWPISEVALFTSRKSYRGRGMGRSLMDAFINTVKERKLKGAFVCTDTALSYKFYEAYGFEIERHFKMKAYRYSIPERPFTALIYYFKIPD